MPDLTIEQMQQAILDKGWQFVEHVFNDGNPHNCYVRFQQSKNPSIFLAGVEAGEKAWGRYQRRHAWRMAYEVIVLGKEEKL